MLRASSVIAVGLFVLVACSSDTPQTVDRASAGSTRSVVCGKATCTGDDYCCGSDGWADAACATSCGSKNPIFCDDASDCPEGNQCCFILKDGNSVVSSLCATLCPIQEDRGQLCSTATNDCVNATCTPIAVSPGGLSQCVSK